MQDPDAHCALQIDVIGGVGLAAVKSDLTGNITVCIRPAGWDSGHI